MDEEKEKTNMASQVARTAARLNRDKPFGQVDQENVKKADRQIAGAMQEKLNVAAEIEAAKEKARKRREETSD